jgi:prepilin-type N-terminal cleavage/methylation domain-containing protein
MPILESNKQSGFTIVELLISIVLLVLIFIFLYGQFNLAQLSTKKTTEVEKTTTKRAKVVELIYNDFLNSPNIEPTSGHNYDKFVDAFITTNSLYGITNPYVKYAVIRGSDSNILVRLESTEEDIDIQNAQSEFYLDTILENVTKFKVIKSNEYLEVFIQAKGMKDIYLKLRRYL